MCQTQYFSQVKFRHSYSGKLFKRVTRTYIIKQDGSYVPRKKIYTKTESFSAEYRIKLKILLMARTLNGEVK